MSQLPTAAGNDDCRERKLCVFAGDLDHFNERLGNILSSLRELNSYLYGILPELPEEPNTKVTKTSGMCKTLGEKITSLNRVITHIDQELLKIDL